MDSMIKAVFELFYDDKEDKGDLDDWLIKRTGHNAQYFIDTPRIYAQSRLMVGEGTFRFSEAYVRTHAGKGTRGSMTSIIPTAYEKRDDELFEDEEVKKRIQSLQERGTPPKFNVDATKLHENPEIMKMAPTQVQFNCPRVGGRRKGESTKKLLDDFLLSVQKVPSVKDIYVTLPKASSYEDPSSQKKCYGKHFSTEYVQVKVKPDPYEKYNISHEMTGTREPRPNLHTNVYKLKKQHLATPQKLFVEGDTEDDSDFDKF